MEKENVASVVAERLLIFTWQTTLRYSAFSALLKLLHQFGAAKGRATS
jgi:hypothetical protein